MPRFMENYYFDQIPAINEVSSFSFVARVLLSKLNNIDGFYFSVSAKSPTGKGIDEIKTNKVCVAIL